MARFGFSLALVLSAAIALMSHAEEPKAAAKGDAQSLFDGKTLTGWTITEFGGEGEVVVKDGQIILSMGQPLTGITWKAGDKIPKDDFEITLQAMKRKGEDFFCGLTFPVRDSHASFIVGGWAGSVVGLSSINGQDASENETTKYETFEKNKWYAIKVRVAGGKIECWIDDKQMVDVELKDNRISTRIEVDANRPLGICCYNVEAALKDIKLRRLK
jgi:3-keto-disaccharide hydrolase